MDGTKHRGFGEQLYERLQSKGLSKGQIYKVLALQRLDPEVAELGAKGLLAEGQMLEISKLSSPARQKQLAELAVEKNLHTAWVKEFSRLIRAAEKEPEEQAARTWDFFFEMKEKIDARGPTKELFEELRQFDPGRAVPPPPAAIPASDGPELTDPDRALVSFEKLALEMGRGLDVGTVNICSAGRETSGKTRYNIQRNAFLDVRNDTFTKKMLMKLGIDYIVQGEKGYVIGDPAFDLANIFEKDTRRPMKGGMISPVEPEALLIVSLLVAQIVGVPQEVGEVCAFSVPADPVDADRNVIYHRGALEAVLRKLGYSPKPMLEGHALIFAELAREEYTGIGISCGGGMFNVCVAYKSVPALTFSTSRGGDWIDQNVASALGHPPPQVCALKETGLDLRNPRDRTEDAIGIYYRHLILYTLEMIKQKFEVAQNMPTFSHPIDIVCAGGTSLPAGFIEIFRDEFEKIHFPLEVKNIRIASDPLRAVAQGCLQSALEETSALKEIQKTSEVMIRRAEITKRTELDEGTKRRIRKIASEARHAPDQVTTVKPPEPPPSPRRLEEAPVQGNGGVEEPALEELQELNAAELEEIPEPEPEEEAPRDFPLIS